MRTLKMKKSSYLKYLNLSFQFFLIVLFFGVVGYFIDNYLFNNVSIFTLFMPLIGFMISLYKVYKSENRWKY